MMAEPVSSGSDVSAGTYRCTDCGNGDWTTVSGGDSADDPYPNR
jgi:hypothetical protein